MNGFWLFVFLINLCLGCSSAPEKRRTAAASSPPIAVLLFDNQSNNVEAGEKVRQEVYRQLKQNGYNPIDLKTIDSELNALGITDGGQLNSVPFNRINERISADRFCYGTVIEFGQKSAVAFTQRKVEVKLKLVDANLDTVIFEGAETGVTSRAGTDAAGDLAIHAAGKIVKSAKEGAKKLLPGKTLKKTADLTDGIADVDLKNETREAVQKLLNRFPK